MNIFFSICVLLLSISNSTNGKEFPVQGILDMAARDTEVRYRWTKKRDIQTAKELRFQEIGNTAFLREIFSEFSIPIKCEPYLNTSILQLVLHSSDLEFQEQMLSKLSPSYSGDMIAVLTDRILLRKGKKQKYGTHLQHINGELVPYPIESPEEVNIRRENIGESTLEKYLEIMGRFDRALHQYCDLSIYKIIFNMVYDFHKNPDEYLYFASFEKEGQQLNKNGSFLAFEDPSLATAFALLLTTPVNGDVLFNGNELLVSLSPHTVDDTLILRETPIYMNVVEKEGFKVHDVYGADFLNRIYRCNESKQAITQFECSSSLETLILTGSKIRILGLGTDHEYQDTLIREKFYSIMYFSITLENESLD